jgi:ribonuclease P protein component
MIDYAEENLSAKQSTPCEDSRVPAPHVNQERPPSSEEAKSEGAEAPDARTLLSDGRLPGESHLRNPAEFRLVYDKGDRFNGSLMTVFVIPNALGFHRFGVTASRKLAQRAVKRNRAKRLLRETFRLSGAELKGLHQRYDWVFNARRALLGVKLAESLKDFQEIVHRVGRKELGTS